MQRFTNRGTSSGGRSLPAHPRARALLMRLTMPLASLLVASIPIAAQWLHYPTAGVPQKPDGSPDLNAPTPRTADGKPDLSGLWAPEKTRPCPPGGCLDMEVGEEFFNIGWTLKDGLPYQPWAKALVEARKAQNGKDDPVSRCMPMGVIKLHTTPQLRKMIQIPGLVIILNEQDANYRQIFTDGRPLPVDPDPSWNGYSVGKWDGDTLVVQSIGFRDDMWLDRWGSPMTSAAKITEKFHRVSYGRLELEVTVDDPKAYTRPWTIKLTEFIALNTDLIDNICAENEKDMPHMVGK
jgi:hypothetical protein